MIARLGEVIYWFANIVAIIAIGAALFAYFAPVMSSNDRIALAGLAAIFGIPIWLVGRASLYILGGR